MRGTGATALYEARTVLQVLRLHNRGPYTSHAREGQCQDFWQESGSRVSHQVRKVAVDCGRLRCKCLICIGVACEERTPKTRKGIENPRVGGSIPPLATKTYPQQTARCCVP